MKNTAKFSLLLLLSTAQQCLEAKKPEPTTKDTEKDETALLKDRKKIPTAKENEREKKRVIYHTIKKLAQECHDILALPRFELEWNSLPQIGNVTEEQVSKAKHEYEMQEKVVNELLKKRREYLSKKHKAYEQLQEQIAALRKHCEAHKKELAKALSNNEYTTEIITAEDKAQPYFLKYWQLKLAYEREHFSFHGPEWRPYLSQNSELSVQNQILANTGKTIDLAPGKSFDLPILYSGNGTLDPERVTKYSLSLPDGKPVSERQAILRTKTITHENLVSMPGATATTYENTVSLTQHAKLDTQFYVLEQHLNGDISVYATIHIMSESKSAKSAKKPTKKAKKAASVKTKKALSVNEKQHNAGHQ